MLDTNTVAICVALVICVTSVTFIVDTLLWREDPAGRIWSLALTSGMAAVVSVVFWMATGQLWFMMVVNALYGWSWLLIGSGLRAMNDKPPGIPATAIAAALTGLATFIPQPYADAPGTLTTGIVICGSSCWIVYEACSGNLRSQRFAHPVRVAFVGMAVYVGSLVGNGLVHPASTLSSTGFLSLNGYLLAIMAVVVVAVANATLLRAEGMIRSTSHQRGEPWEALASGLFSAEAFTLFLDAQLQRARAHHADIVVYCVDLDDVRTIERAFGRQEHLHILDTWSRAVRQFSPPHAVFSLFSPGRLVIAAPALLQFNCETDAARIQAGLLETVERFPAGFHPTVSIGVALASQAGWQADRLIARAAALAESAAASGGDGVATEAQAEA